MKHSMLLLLTLACACGAPTDDGSNHPPKANNKGKGDLIKDDSSLCVGVRGNGERIFAHFGALARIHEEYGTIEGIAGGSSASITGFISESIYLNPALRNCGDETCSDKVIGQRISLMYKSISGYLEILSTTDEATSLMQLKGISDLIAKKQVRVDQLLLDKKYKEARNAIIEILQNKEISGLLNPELIALLKTSKNLKFHVIDIWGALKGFGSFKVDSDLLLIRPSVINFENVALKVGRIGTFYAGMGPDKLTQWNRFFSECSEKSVGKQWPELEGITLQNSEVSCRDLFHGMLSEWRTEYLADEANQPSRLNDNVGVGLSTLISTSIITGDSVKAFKDARSAYLDGAPISLDVDFNDVKYGYWGQKEDLSSVAKNKNEYKDLKTQKFLGLGGGKWKDALSFSPAEPGLSRALEINDTMVSAGGWSNLAPTMVLKNMGCDEVILITREGEIQGGFGPSVAGLLGADTDVDNALYDLDGESAIHASLNAADGIWCTNWDGVQSTDIGGAFFDAYNAPLEAKSKFVKEAGYEGAVDSVNKPACSPGVPGK